MQRLGRRSRQLCRSGGSSPCGFRNTYSLLNMGRGSTNTVSLRCSGPEAKLFKCEFFSPSRCGSFVEDPFFGYSVLRKWWLHDVTTDGKGTNYSVLESIVSSVMEGETGWVGYEHLIVAWLTHRSLGSLALVSPTGGSHIQGPATEPGLAGMNRKLG